MRYQKGVSISFTFGAMLCLQAAAGFANEVPVLFSDDFESAVDGSPNPVWNWQAPFSPVNPYGMMYGAGDIYSSKVVSVGGRQSSVLSLNFDGRNGFCNICGSVTHEITSTELQNGCVSVGDGPFAGKVFNKSGGFSSWIVTSTDAQGACFQTDSPLGQSLFGDNAIEAGDELKLPYQCGVNGTIGGNVDRRSDCNLAINYLRGINTQHFEPGMTLARRMFLYIPSSTVMPGSGLKLGYTVFQRLGEQSGKIIPVYRTSRDAALEVDGNQYFGYRFPNYQLSRDTWHYLEEVWTRESVQGTSDGTYKLYAGPVGGDTSTPLLTLTGIEYGDIKDLSIIGNWQHNNDAVGSIYIDNVMVANGFIGQGEPGTAGPVSPPAPPTLEVE